MKTHQNARVHKHTRTQAHTSTAFEVTGLSLIHSSSSPPHRVRGCMVFQFVDVEGLNNIRQLPVDQNSPKELLMSVARCRKLIIFGRSTVHIFLFFMAHKNINAIFLFIFSLAQYTLWKSPEPHPSHF